MVEATQHYGLPATASQEKMRRADKGLFSAEQAADGLVAVDSLDRLSQEGGNAQDLGLRQHLLRAEGDRIRADDAIQVGCA